MTLTREEIVQRLRNGTHMVEFKKKDGTIREMICTLDESFIPEVHLPKSEDTKYSEDAIRVFETTIQEWRAFRFESVIRFDYL